MAAYSGPPPQQQGQHASNCPSETPYPPNAAYYMHYGAPQHGVSAATAPPQSWVGGVNPALAYASMPTPFEQVAPPAASGGPQWFQGPGGAYPWPSNVSPYGAPPPWQNGAPPYAAPPPMDQPQWSARREEWQPWSARAPEHLQMQPTHGNLRQDAMSAHPVMPVAHTMPMQLPTVQNETHNKDIGRKCNWRCCYRPKLPNFSVKCSCFTKIRDVLLRICPACDFTAERNQACWQLAMVAAVGVGAVGSLIAALIADPPHLMAAGLAVVVGLLICYTYIVQGDCALMTAKASAQASPSVEVGPALESVRTMAATDLDVTGLAINLGSRFAACNSSVLTERGKGKTGQTMQTVLTSALVKEYLRCSDQLEKYQSKYGILPNAPTCTPGFAEALRIGLNSNSTSNIMKVASPSRAALKSSPDRAKPSLAAVFTGTPNFETRFPPLDSQSLQVGSPPREGAEAAQLASPEVVRTSAYAESQKSAIMSTEMTPVRSGANPFGSAASSYSQLPLNHSPPPNANPPFNTPGSSPQVPLNYHSPSSEVPPPIGDLESCRTIYQAKAPQGYLGNGYVHE